MASTASGRPCTTASTLPSRRFATHPDIPRRSASIRIDSRNHTPCTSPWIARWRVTRSVIVRHPAAVTLDGGALLLRLDAAPLRGGRGLCGDALLRHVIEPLQPLGQALEGRLAIAELRRRILRRDHDARGRMREAQRRLGLVHVLAARPARAEHLDHDLALERIAIERIRRRALRGAGGHRLQLYWRGLQVYWRDARFCDRPHSRREGPAP